jgi:DeoR family transcriptional regulator, aga operon transcriptional repressor
MAPHERWNTLLEILARDGSLVVDTAARELAVSTATIRRDLDQLAQQQMITRTRGGALPNSVSYDLPLRYKTSRKASEKQRIARTAAGLAAPGAVVGLNGGTTTTEVARALAARADLNAGGDQPGLTVVTNALNIANELIVRRHVKIVVTGGVARPQSYELIGPLATRLLTELAIDQLYLGVDAVNVEHGATAYHEGEAEVNQLMVSSAGTPSPASARSATCTPWSPTPTPLTPRSPSSSRPASASSEPNGDRHRFDRTQRRRRSEGLE